MSNNIARLLTEARKLIAAMDPQPGSGLDAVDELVHAALIHAESEAELRVIQSKTDAAVSNAKRLLVELLAESET